MFKNHLVFIMVNHMPGRQYLYTETALRIVKKNSMLKSMLLVNKNFLTGLFYWMAAVLPG